MKPDFLRNFIFGVEDSLVSTVGLLSGVAAAQLSGGAIVLTGLILIVVEAFSMGVGSMLSDHSAREYAGRSEVALSGSVTGGLIMFFSYIIAGIIPLAPYLIFTQVELALTVSIIISLLTLFALGWFIGQLSRIRKLRAGLEMVLLGGLAIGLGVLIGRLLGA